MGEIYARVIVNNKSSNTDKEYTYLIEESIQKDINIGSKVIVPFGQGNRLIEAFVVDIRESTETNISNIKTIKKVAEKNYLPREMIELCRWMQEKYMCQFIEALLCVVPTGTSLKLQNRISLNKKYFETVLESLNCTLEQKRIISVLQKRNNCSEDFIKLHIGAESIQNDLKALLNMNIITINKEFKSNTQSVYKKIIKIHQEKSVEEILKSISKSAFKQKFVLDILRDKGSIEYSILTKEMGVSRSTINSLLEKGFIEIDFEVKRRDPYKGLKLDSNLPPKLTLEQESIIRKINLLKEKGIYKSFLIHGVTGSGKTEVYMRIVENIINKSKDAIVLVPEITLATQIVERFKARFGDIVAILHSKLSSGERLDEWNRIKNGDVKIVIGARSAVFAPFTNLGVIIMDEEHEGTYKSEQNPKYNTVDVAKKRCSNNDALLILGSATPSLESYYKAERGEYYKLELTKRYNETPLPNIRVVDMREEINRGNNSIYSQRLFEETNKCLSKNQQIIFFLNRRGYSTFVSCRSCGYVAKCPNCDISLTYHNHSQRLLCHYCGYTSTSPKTCPTCSSRYIKFFGIGTEKLEELTKRTYPNARVARVDLDTTSRKGSIDNILMEFKKGNIDILVGTQMIAKGLDFPNVGLVGVISADTSLNLPDFRSAERTFQLITQVAGRAGRGTIPGKVIVQTYEPDHYSITAAMKNDFTNFYNKELLLRREFKYPPFINLVSLFFISENEFLIRDCSESFKERLIEYISKLNIETNDILGPQAAPISKVNKRYRWQLIIKCPMVDQNTLNGIISDIKKELLSEKKYNGILITIDINPYNML